MASLNGLIPVGFAPSIQVVLSEKCSIQRGFV